MIKLKQEELDRISHAVETAEKKTSGEIALAMIPQSDSYAVFELMAAVICGFIWFVALLFWINPIGNWLGGLFWGTGAENSAYPIVMLYGFSSFLLISVIYALVNIPVIDRLIVPRRYRNVKVSERAQREFLDSGVYNTRDRTGILIFISQLEHRVELIADKGIAQKIEQKQWDEIVQRVVDGIRRKRLAESLCEAVAMCGDLLEKHFPIKEDDTNELTNKINILER